MFIDVNNVPDKLKEARELLNFYDENLGYPDENNHVYINYDKVISYYDQITGAMDNLLEDVMQLQYDESGVYEYINLNSSNEIYRTLINRLKMPESKFTSKGKTSFKLEVLNRYNTSYPHPIVKKIIEWKELESVRKGLKWYYDNLVPIEGITNNEGDRIAKIRVNYRLIETLRLETYEPNLQGLNLDIADIITAKKDWVIVQVDSGQIEPRLWYSTVIKDPLMKWLIEQYDDVYYAVTDYCLRESTDYTPENLHLTDSIDKSQRDAVKVIILSGSYGSSQESIRYKFREVAESLLAQTPKGRAALTEINSIKLYEAQLTSDKVPDKYKGEIRQKWEVAMKHLDELTQYSKFLSDRYISRILNHPQRKRLEREIRDKVSSGTRVVTSLFGDERPVRGDFNYLKNCFLNNPMQMAVSRLSAITICKAFEFIKSLPNGQDYIRYAFQKHDECIYYVRRDKVEELAPILKDFRSYEFEDWIPIRGDMKIGLDYKK